MITFTYPDKRYQTKVKKPNSEDILRAYAPLLVDTEGYYHYYVYVFKFVHGLEP